MFAADQCLLTWQRHRCVESVMKAAAVHRVELRLALLEEDGGEDGAGAKTAATACSVEMGGDGGLEFVGSIRGADAAQKASAFAVAIRAAVAATNRLERSNAAAESSAASASPASAATRILWWRAALRDEM